MPHSYRTRGSTCPFAPISIPNEAPHIARSHDAAAAAIDQTTSSPALAKNRSYENDGGLRARSRKKVTAPKITEAIRFSSGRKPRPRKLNANPATRNQTPSNPKEEPSTE